MTKQSHFWYTSLVLVYYPKPKYINSCGFTAYNNLQSYHSKNFKMTYYRGMFQLLCPHTHLHSFPHFHQFCLPAPCLSGYSTGHGTAESSAKWLTGPASKLILPSLPEAERCQLSLNSSTRAHFVSSLSAQYDVFEKSMLVLWCLKTG